MTIISRRSFLSSTSIAMCAFARPAIAGLSLANQPRQRHANMDAILWHEVIRVRFQLWDYRDRLLPLLLRRPAMDTDFRYLGFRRPKSAYLAAYRHASDHLIKAMPTNGDGVSIASLDHDEVVAPILALSMDAKDGRELYRRCEFGSCIANYCRIVQDGFRWNLSSMGPRFPQAMLDGYAEEIVEFMKGPERMSSAIAAVNDGGLYSLMRAFTVMPLETYWNLILPLFQMAPKSPSVLLAVRRGNATLRFGETIRPMEHSYLYSTQMSMLCSFIMEYFANDHFSRIQGIAWLRETCGNWHGFMARQILDILYQKVIVLRRLCSSGTPPAEMNSVWHV